MLKSEIVQQLKALEESEAQLMVHFEALGADKRAFQHSKESSKWEFLAELLQENIEEEGDSDIHSGMEPVHDEFSVITDWGVDTE